MVQDKVECSCTHDAPWCRLLAGKSPWFFQEFDHGYANEFFRFFRHGDLGMEPFFRRWHKYTWQTRPLVLKDLGLEQTLLLHFEELDRMRSFLPSKLSPKESSLFKYFNTMKRSLCLKISSRKFNHVRNTLLRFLFTILPKTEAER